MSEAPTVADTGIQRRFKAGDRITVRDDYPIGHIRTPVYVRGKSGVVTRYIGAFKNPEPKKNLYEVRFLQTDIWPDYAGGKNDSVLIDLYEHWLERA